MSTPSLQDIDALIEKYGECDGAVAQACLAYIRAQDRSDATAIASLREELEKALTLVSVMNEACIVHDSYGVPGSGFETCICCGAGGAPQVEFRHKETCPVGKAEATAEQWFREHREEAIERDKEENRLAADSASLRERVRVLEGALDRIAGVCLGRHGRDEGMGKIHAIAAEAVNEQLSRETK